MRLHAIVTTSTALFLGTLSFAAQAVVESGHWQVTAGASPNQGGNTIITMDQTAAGDYTSNFFTYDAKAGTLQFITRNIDEGASLFMATPGQVLTHDSIKALPSTSFLSSSTPVKVGTDFYIGGASFKFSDPEFSSTNTTYTVFGWAHLQADAKGVLKVLDSAVAFREPGIIVGTTQAVVPEPGSFAMLGLGLLGMGAVMRRQSSKA